MKNYNFDKLDNLPYKISGKKLYGCRNLRYGYRLGSSSKNPWKIATRIIDNNIGKSFDLAFHYFCTKVKKHEQYIFFKDFVTTKRYLRGYYFIDAEGNIQEIKSKPIKITCFIYSKDYKEETFHKETGKSIKEFMEISYYKNKPIPWPLRLFKSRKSIKNYGYIIASFSDFEQKVVSGSKKLVETEEDKKIYNRLEKEKNKKYILSIKRDKKARKKIMPEDEFRFWLSKKTYQEKEEEKQLYQNLKNEEINTLKILSHGFDLETSFRTDRKFKK